MAGPLQTSSTSAVAAHEATGLGVVIASAAPPHPAEVAARQRANLLRFVRIVFAVLVVTFTMLAILRAAGESKLTATTSLWWIPALAAVVMVAVVSFVERLAAFKRIATLSAVLFGVLAGLLVTVAAGGLIDLLMQSWVPQSEAYEWVRPIVDSTKIIMGVCLSYLGVVTVLQTQDDFRLVIPYVEFSKQLRGVRPVLVDSSALIDGRVVDVAATNFIQFPLVVPRSVIQELQLLADQTDAAKRGKGRRGLDCIGKLQRLGTVDVSIDETNVPGKGVDSALVELAKQLQAAIMTTDTALQRIASINGVPVLNVHELAQSTKQALSPGEETTLRITRAGEQAGQGVGYLADGTMVVVDDAEACMGTLQQVVISGSLQTSAGRLLFAKLVQPVMRDGPVRDGPTREPQPGQPAQQGHRAKQSQLPQLPGESSASNAAGEAGQSGSQAGAPQSPAGNPAPDSGDEPRDPQGEGSAGPDARDPRGPFPPRPPRSFRAASPRNPRR
jgi:uncharacterized protein YacL